MNGPLRWLWRGLLLLAVLLAGGLVALRLAFDLNDYRAEIERRATEVAGKPVRILGDLGWGLGLMPTIAISDVEVGAEAAPDARLGGIRVGVPLSAILSGDLFSGGMPGRLHISVDNLRLKDRALGDFTAPVRLGRRAFSVDPLEGDLPEGGEITAVVTYADNALKADAEVSGVDYAMILPGATGGDMSGKLALTGTGATAEDILQGLNGTVSLYGGAGRLSGDAIGLWANDVLSTILTGRQSHTDVTCLAIDGIIKGGVLRPSLAVLDTDSARVSASGRIDLGNQRLNLVVTPAPKEPALVSLATPLRVEGPWSSPGVAPDGRAVIEKAAGLLLGAVAPPAALLSFMDKGDSSASPCARKAAVP
jgi:uncharacterized protein involved in outer membrane biogenesis